ncbi:MAG: YkgJ family cysteine cluster protein [Deltaproteobacteria bacterium]|nr:YkgJ family cysteine cluster protein [Deltaproteobacteria bacterium]
MMLNLSKTFEKYEALVVEIDKIFKGMQGSHKDCMRCEIHCSDCCHAVFDLTLVEAVYISHHFNKSLSEKEREPILERAETADRKYYQIKKKLHKMYIDQGKPPEEVFLELSRARVPCPLLNEENLCDLYDRRPITCRVYGIPTSIGGKAHTCEKADFKEGTAYPTVNLDKMNDRLFELSRQLLEEIGSKNAKMHMSLVPPSVALITEYNEDYFGVK